MDDALSHLPDDPAALKAIIAEVIRQRDEQAARLCQRVDELEVEKLRLEVELLRLKKWYYGPRADTLAGEADLAQMLLSFATGLEARPVDPADIPPEVQSDVDAGGGPAAAKTVRRVKRGRRNLAGFDRLPVTRIVHDLNEGEKTCPCCGRPFDPIGQESSWQVEYIPARFERIEHVRLKYACKDCEANGDGPQITVADKPAQPIERGMAGPGLLAYVVTSKYADYLPLYRLENIFQRNGLEISRSTQCLWCRDVAELLGPLYRRMIQRVLASHLVCTDETVMPMLAPDKTLKARMWVYIGDDANPYNVFDFTQSRGRDGPMSFLKNFNQTLLADAYGGYDGVVVGNDITRAGCWAHARRKFVDAEKAQPQIAAEAVGIIKRLYAIEERGKSISDDERTALRQRESADPRRPQGQAPRLGRHAPAQAPGPPGGRLRTQPVDRAERLRLRRLGADRQQRQRAGDEAGGAQPQEQPVRGQPAWRAHRRGPQLLHQHRQTPRRRPATVLHPAPDQPARHADQPTGPVVAECVEG